MNLEYSEEPKDGKLFKSPEAYKYLENGIEIMGLRQPSDLKPEYHKIYKIWGFVVKFISIPYAPASFILSFVKDFDKITPNELVGMSVIFFNVPAISVKLIILMTNFWRLSKGKELLDAMYMRCVSHEELLQVHGISKFCHSITYLYTLVYVMVPTTKYFSSVLSGFSPFNLYNPFIDWRESTKSLWITATIDSVILMPVVCCNIIVDCMPLIFGITVREHLKLLIKRVQKLRENPELMEQQHFEELVLCIKDHKLILEYCDLMRPYVTRSLFVQFTAIAFVLASTLIHLLFFATFLTGFFSVWYILACMMQSFPVCFTCDLIIEDCDELAMAIFHSNWISAEKRYKMALIYFMQNVQKPIKFISGGVLPICQATYSKMVKMAFSLITFIRQINLFEEMQ